MNKRPVAVTVVAWLLLVTGVFGFAIHFRELRSQEPFHSENVWILAVALLAVASGIFLLLGHNWARWMALAWMAFHVAISFFDSLQKVAVHLLLFILIAYFLFRPGSGAYFRHSA